MSFTCVHTHIHCVSFLFPSRKRSKVFYQNVFPICGNPFTDITTPQNIYIWRALKRYFDFEERRVACSLDLETLSFSQISQLFLFSLSHLLCFHSITHLVFSVCVCVYFNSAHTLTRTEVKALHWERNISFSFSVTTW